MRIVCIPSSPDRTEPQVGRLALLRDGANHITALRFGDDCQVFHGVSIWLLSCATRRENRTL